MQNLVCVCRLIGDFQRQNAGISTKSEQLKRHLHASRRTHHGVPADARIALCRKSSSRPPPLHNGFHLFSTLQIWHDNTTSHTHFYLSLPSLTTRLRGRTKDTEPPDKGWSVLFVLLLGVRNVVELGLCASGTIRDQPHGTKLRTDCLLSKPSSFHRTTQHISDACA